MIIPNLYVEGKDDISVINALLSRHGVDTAKGKRHLCIKDQESVELLLENMPEAIKAATDRPVGFVLDIDINIIHRWQAVQDRLRKIGLNTPAICPENGFVGRLTDYPYPFGVWLMPDCKTDGQMLEHLITTLLPTNDPLWPHAKVSTAAAAKLVDNANVAIPTKDGREWKRFSNHVQIKAEVHSWLAWQREPGAPLGAAINDRILRHDSSEAIRFLSWLKTLFVLDSLAV